MKKCIVPIAFLLAGLALSAQVVVVVPIPISKDTLLRKERDRASATLRSLKNGSMVVLLKKNQRSVDAYRYAGKEEIAMRIEEDRKLRNLKIYWAFKNHFRFCRVYFIYAHETDRFLNGEAVTLNKDLKKDSSMIFNDTTFVFCEYGSAQPFSNFNDISLVDRKENRIGDFISTQKSTSPTTNGLVLSDKNHQQFGRPFPYVIPVNGENYNAAVKSLDRELERKYRRLVIRGDFNKRINEDRKKQKDQFKLIDQ